MEMKRAEKMYKNIIDNAKKDPNVLGLILFGSRGMGKEFIHIESDYDLMLIVKDKVKKNYGAKKIEVPKIDLTVKSESEIKSALEEWERDTYARIKILVNKTSWLKKHLEEISKIPKSQIEDYIKGNLDGYINYIYRSLKCWRDKNEIGARLEANRTIEIFLKVAFALHDRKTVPYYKYLEKDLKNHPLNKFGISSNRLLLMIGKVIDNADVKTQQELLKISERTFRNSGYGKVFDSWGEKLSWMKCFKN